MQWIHSSEAKVLRLAIQEGQRLCNFEQIYTLETGQRGGRTGPDGGLDGRANGGARRGPHGGQTGVPDRGQTGAGRGARQGCPTGSTRGPDGVLDGGQTGPDGVAVGRIIYF
jgi:hypothetical protein